MRQQWWVFLAAIAAAVDSVRLLPAQAVEADVRVRLESIDGSRVSGALVALMDSAEHVVREGVSGEDGARSLRAPTGSYRVRVRRIGFHPFVSDPVAVVPGGEITLRVESPRVVLETIVVTSRSNCGPIDPRERILSAVWGEIAKALRASQLSPPDFSDVAHAYVYRKNLDSHGVVISSDTSFRPVGSTKPFRVRDADALAAHGYVFGNEREGWTYYAPDEAVLLSDQFASTHCFQVVREKTRPGQVGIAFAPATNRSVPDIAGVLWVDQSAAELRELIFRYVKAGPLERFKAGGFARFRRVASGSWIVDDWALRGPILEKSRDIFTDLKVVGYVEDGGGMTRRKTP